MQLELSRWVPFAVALTASIAILMRNVQGKKERRSWGQLLIFTLYRGMRLVWAVLRGIDVGYLEYRRVLQQTSIEIQNEKCLGKIIRGGKATLYDWQRHEA